MSMHLPVSWPAPGRRRLKATGATFPNDDLNLNIGHRGYILVATTVLWYCPGLTMHELHELHTGGGRSDPSDGVHTGTLKLAARGRAAGSKGRPVPNLGSSSFPGVQSARLIEPARHLRMNSACGSNAV